MTWFSIYLVLKQFAIVEVVVTSIQDGFPNWIKRKLVYHELLVLILCVIAFFFGLPNIIQVKVPLSIEIWTDSSAYIVLGRNVLLPTSGSLCRFCHHYLHRILWGCSRSMVLWRRTSIEVNQTNDRTESVFVFPVLLVGVDTSVVVGKMRHDP